MKKILLVFGTRPEAIKMAPLVKEFQKDTINFEIKVCVTAQHREMLDQVLNLFEIIPDYDLNLMKPKQNLYDITSNILLGIKKVLEDFKPNIVLVHGDTTTTMTTSLAAFYQQIKIGHIEAGLRAGDLSSPFPEEANRQITGVLANYHFAPTTTSQENLLKENKDKNSILVAGNTVIDALFLALDKIKNNKDLENQIIKDIENQINNSQFSILNSQFILVTGHRRENHGQGFINICKALKEIAINNPTFNIVYPVHLNPNVQKPVREILSNVENIYLIEPLQYEQFIYLMDKSYFIITDSGGVQEEAPSLGKPVLVMRDNTERAEALEAGTVKLVGTTNIEKELGLLLDSKQEYDKYKMVNNPYGSGNTSKNIYKIIECIL